MMNQPIDSDALFVVSKQQNNRPSLPQTPHTRTCARARTHTHTHRHTHTHTDTHRHTHTHTHTHRQHPSTNNTEQNKTLNKWDKRNMSHNESVM
jgi:hypothetical protein